MLRQVELQGRILPRPAAVHSSGMNCALSGAAPFCKIDKDRGWAGRCPSSPGMKACTCLQVYIGAKCLKLEPRSSAPISLEILDLAGGNEFFHTMPHGIQSFRSLNGQCALCCLPFMAVCRLTHALQRMRGHIQNVMSDVL